jgi:hypothetical protein
LANGSSSYSKKHIALGDVMGQRLIDIRIVPETGATRFEFDLDTILEVRRMRRGSKDELWLLYERDKLVRLIRGDGSYDRQRLGRDANSGHLKGTAKGILEETLKRVGDA